MPEEGSSSAADLHGERSGPLRAVDAGADLHLDLGGPGPGRRAGLESALRQAVRTGRLAAGARLPSTRALAAGLGLSRGTVTAAAYAQLTEEGYLSTRPGSGTTVTDLPAAGAPPSALAASAVLPRHDLRPGLPDVRAFPARAWLASTRRVLATAGPDVLGAGDPRGRPELRAALAGHLGRTRGVLAAPDQVVITSGFYQSVRLLGEVLAARGATTVAMEDPGHDLYREAVRRSGLATVPLAVDGHGARVGDLGPGTGAAVVTPAHQYPTGVPLHPERRGRLCSWARATGGLVVEDDYDGEFRYDRRPVGALQGLAPDRVVYCGTASKSLGPALRLAWMVLPPDLVGPVVAAKREADLYTETLGQLVLADLIASHGYDRHVRAARLRYRRRRELLTGRLAELPAVTPHGVPAGLHTLVTWHGRGPGEPEVLGACAERGIALRGSAELYHRAGGAPPGLLVGFAAASGHGFPVALDALAGVLADVLG
ncbi:PLP-dependent aminotransferase family protein [Streptomyces sp. NPDC101118]|uniref:MocR-like pyridoxine biosynthesis transcription factor PdxR n=1 Tax=Streptomyces sp. NPDC101118 TaxID=3366109 RepID=UPI00381334B7